MTILQEPLEKYLQAYTADATPIRELLRRVKLSPDRVWLVGGAARKLYTNLPISTGDLDIAFQKGPTLHRRRDALEKRWGEFHYTGNSSSFTGAGGLKVQLLHELYKSPGDIFHKFDISVCNFATDGVSMFTTEEAVEDCAKGRFTVRLKRQRVNLPAIYIPGRGFKIDHTVLEEWVPLALSTRMFKYLFMGFVSEQPEVVTLMRSILANVLGYKLSRKRMPEKLTKRDKERIIKHLTVGLGSVS